MTVRLPDAQYRFAELQLLGWHLTRLALPKRRPGAADVIRRAMFVDQHERVMVFDVDRHGRMRGHATYTGDDESSWLAENAQAAVWPGRQQPRHRRR